MTPDERREAWKLKKRNQRRRIYAARKEPVQMGRPRKDATKKPAPPKVTPTPRMKSFERVGRLHPSIVRVIIAAEAAETDPVAKAMIRANNPDVFGKVG